MLVDLNDTIVALASAPGPALRGIVRISGDRCAELIASLFKPNADSTNWRESRVPRRWTGRIHLLAADVTFDAALSFWPTSRSYTGQVMGEFHLVGCEPLLDALLAELCRRGARMAQRGEFTLRAFLSGRIDLVQAEAVLGVIEAADHEELQKALSQLGGSVTERLKALRGDLIALLGDLEAGLDFVEEDIEFITSEQILQRLERAVNLVNHLLRDSSARLPAGYRRRVVLAGLPNAGKSTLFNALIGEDKAIVSSIPGTTRDYVSAMMMLDAIPMELIDTAGWEISSDVIMTTAQSQRSEQVASADLVIWCRSSDLHGDDRSLDLERYSELKEKGTPLLLLETRADLNQNTRHDNPQVPDHRVSVITGQGIPELHATLRSRLSSTNIARSELLASTAVRCRDSLQKSVDCLQRAIAATETQAGHELVSMEIREAQYELATVVGEVYTDDMLDHIFSNFCIGK
ncbi:MAG: tRNA modification GTPase [Planctomycetaceae bacterium]|nr:tRNA modification GTPase [Planctomycetaceae bacterium]